jgi:hypothetical protein
MVLHKAEIEQLNDFILDNAPLTLDIYDVGSKILAWLMLRCFRGLGIDNQF